MTFYLYEEGMGQVVACNCHLVHVDRVVEVTGGFRRPTVLSLNDKAP